MLVVTSRSSEILEEADRTGGGVGVLWDTIVFNHKQNLFDVTISINYFNKVKIKMK